MQMQSLIMTALTLALFVVQGWAFVDAVSRRPDAFVAADKLTKPAWLGITGGATVALLLFSFAGIGWIFWIAGLVAALVYIVDIRPRLIEVQRGQRW